MKKFGLASALICLTFIAYGQRITVYPITPGGGTSSGAGSITNLSPAAASIGRSATITLSHPTNPTNFYRLLTNTFNESFGTNVEAFTSATNGWIRPTNSGLHEVTAFIVYKVLNPSAVLRTNVFGISSNAAVVGTNMITQVSSVPNTNVNIPNLVSMQAQAFLASNTFVSLGMISPINIAATNEIVIEKVYLDATLIAGSTFGAATGLAELPSYVLTNNETKNVVLTSTLTNTGAAGFGSTLIVGGQTTLRDTVFFHGAPNSIFANGGVNANILRATNSIQNQGWQTNAGGLTNGGVILAFNDIVATNNGGGFYTAINNESVVTSKNTTNKLAIFDANGKLINATGTPAGDGSKFLNENGALAVPPGGSATPGGPTTAIQFNTAGAFDGHADLTWIAGTNTINIFDNGLAVSRPGIFITNEVLGWSSKLDHTSLSASEILFLGAGGVQTANRDWAIDGSQGGALTYIGVGDGQGHIRGNHIKANVFSNATYNIPGAASVVTIYATNQFWKGSFDTNVTFANDALAPDVDYIFYGVTNSATITYPGHWKWRNTRGFTVAPTFANQGAFRFKVRISDSTTNAWVVDEQTIDLAFGSLHLVATTNSGIATVQVTNFSGVGTAHIVTSNAPTVFTPSFLSDVAFVATNANNAYLRAANSNAVPTTNVFGVLHKSTATPLFLDANHGRNFTLTNRYGADSTIVLTNMWDGDEVTIVAIGEASANDRVITIIGHGGVNAAVADLDTFGVAIGPSKAFTLTNGNAVEISARTTRMLQSNVTAIVTRQFKF